MVFNSSFKATATVYVGFLFRGLYPCFVGPHSDLRWPEQLWRPSTRWCSRPSLAVCSSSKRGPLPSREPSIRMKQMSHYGSFQSVPARLILLFSWNVWEFLILWRGEEGVILGPVWLFINLPFPFLSFLGGLLFFSLSPTLSEKQRYKDPEQSCFFYCTPLKKSALVVLKSQRKLGLERGGCFSNKSSGNIMKSLCYARQSFARFSKLEHIL